MGILDTIEDGAGTAFGAVKSFVKGIAGNSIFGGISHIAEAGTRGAELFGADPKYTFGAEQAGTLNGLANGSITREQGAANLAGDFAHMETTQALENNGMSAPLASAAGTALGALVNKLIKPLIEGLEGMFNNALHHDAPGAQKSANNLAANTPQSTDQGQDKPRVSDLSPDLRAAALTAGYQAHPMGMSNADTINLGSGGAKDKGDLLLQA